MRIDDLHTQQRIDSVPLMNVHLNPRSRDETVKLIRGLQGVYADATVRQQVLDLIAQDVLQGARRDIGRPGMDLWSVFVLLAAREALRLDYDRLEDLAEHHTLIRAAMGLGDWQAEYHFDWTRIWRNVRKVRPETLVEISRRVVQLGHTLAPTAAESARVDSFVMQTNIHHPSDVRQVADGLRLVLRHAVRLAEAIGSTALRQHVHLEKRARALVLIASRASASKHRDRDQRLTVAARELCTFADERCQQALDLGGCRLPCHLVDVGDHDVRTFGGKPSCGGEPDPAGAAGHHRDPIDQPPNDIFADRCVHAHPSVARKTFLTSVKAPSASGPSSRPRPDCLKPPNGVE